MLLPRRSGFSGGGVFFLLLALVCLELALAAPAIIKNVSKEPTAEEKQKEEAAVKHVDQELDDLVSSKRRVLLRERLIRKSLKDGMKV